MLSLLLLSSIIFSSSSSSSKLKSHFSPLSSKKLCKIIAQSVKKIKCLIFLTEHPFKHVNLDFKRPNAFSTTTLCNECIVLNFFSCKFEDKRKGVIQNEEIGYLVLQ